MIHIATVVAFLTGIGIGALAYSYASHSDNVNALEQSFRDGYRAGYDKCFRDIVGSKARGC